MEKPSLDEYDPVEVVGSRPLGDDEGYIGACLGEEGVEEVG